MSPSRTVRRVVALAGASALLLSGCGSATPGTAMMVGDERLALAEVDANASAYCEVISGSEEGQLAEQPARGIRQEIAVSMAIRTVLDDLMEQYDVSAGAEFTEAERQARSQFGDLDEERRDELARVAAAIPGLNYTIPQIGASSLAEEGNTEPTYEEAVQRGDELVGRAFAEIDDIDPRLGLSVEDGQFMRADTAVSVAVSDTAVSGQDPEPGLEYTESLAASGRC